MNSPDYVAVALFAASAVSAFLAAVKATVFPRVEKVAAAVALAAAGLVAYLTKF